MEGAVDHLRLEGVASGDVLARYDAFANREGEAVRVFLDDRILEPERVVAAIAAGLAQVEVNSVFPVWNRDLHMPVIRVAAYIPADAPEDVDIFGGAAKAERRDTGRVRIGPGRDGLRAAKVIGADVEGVRVDSLISQPGVAVGVGYFRPATINPERDIELSPGSGGCHQTKAQQ